MLGLLGQTKVPMSVDPYLNPTSRFDATSWSDDSARAALQLIVESVAQMVGFEVAVISAVQGDGIVSVAIEGSDEVSETLHDLHTPLTHINRDLGVADDWGRFKFVPHERVLADDEFRWVPDLQPGTEPDAWHPLNMLMAPLQDEEGELCGLLSIDVPLNGRRPDAVQRQLLERYAAQAERALINALERDHLAQRLRLAEAARKVVRIAVSQPDVDAALQQCRAAMLEGFRADDLRIRTYPDQFLAEAGTSSMPVTDRLRQMVRDLACDCWDRQRVGIMNAQWHDEELLTRAAYDELMELMRSLRYASAMIVPIGAGQRCLGHLILVRDDETIRWTTDEQASALEVARDIGHAVLAARNLTREQRLVTELRRLDNYKTQLLSTVSHELKNPLGAIAGHLELVASTPGHSEDTQFSIGAMERATARVARVVDDLLTLAKLEDPDAEKGAAPLDLRPAIDAALEDARFAAERRELSVRVDAPAGPLPVCGDDEGLKRVLTNLVSNAVKYTGRGGAVVVSVTYRDTADGRPASSAASLRGAEVEVAVTDQGIGISQDDQQHLFTEFFRSTNPTALAEPGTGLGLAISARIVRRHGGRIAVESALGEGSTFRVFLPVPKQD